MIGQTFGHYRILEEIGSGGMGVVYRAHDEHLGRDVALKVLPAHALADETARRHLLREARTASALNHPHICTIYEVGDVGGRTYIAMELVEGRPLSRLVPSEGLLVETVVRYGAQIADALAHAHKRGVVHRDLKTANVVVTPEGQAKVLDFGLASRYEERLPEVTRSQASLAEAGGIAGTLAYMAPEVLRGGPADARSDIWALGVVLYEMAKGELPFKGQTGFALSSAILRDQPRALPPQVPPALGAAIQRCLAKEPAQRYEQASEVRAALETLASGTTPAAAPLMAPRASRRWLMAGTFSLLLLAILVAWNPDGWRERLFGTHLSGLPGSAASQPVKSLAVLPLENLSHDPEQEYFADGMTDAVITDLAKIGALRVISRTSVMRYKRTQKSIPEIAKELNVDAVMEGSIEHSGSHVRITAQLIRAATDQHLWAEAYDRDVRDVLSVQEEIAKSIAREVQVKLTPQEQALLTKGRPVDPEAYELYLKGRYFWLKSTKESIDKAIGLYQQAIDRDPAYAPPYSGLADCYTTLGVSFGVGALSPTQAISQARAAAEKAIELDDAMAEGHNSLAMTKLLFDWDWAGSEAEFKRALELNPGSANVHHSYAHLLIAEGRIDQAFAESKRALDLDRLSTVMSLHLGWHYVYAHQYDLALDQLRKTLELDPNFGYAFWYMGRAYEQQGKYADALQAMRRAQDLLKGNIDVAADTGHVYAVSGDKSAAFRVLEQLKKESRKKYVSPSEVALIYVALDAKTEAFQWLERAYTERSDLLIYLNVEPRFDSIRSDPHFVDLVHRIGFPQ